MPFSQLFLFPRNGLHINAYTGVYISVHKWYLFPYPKMIFFPLSWYIVFQFLSLPFCLNSSLFCIYFTLYFPFLFFFPHSSFLFPLSSFYCLLHFPPLSLPLFIFFPPNDIGWYFFLPRGVGIIFQYIDPCAYIYTEIINCRGALLPGYLLTCLTTPCPPTRRYEIYRLKIKLILSGKNSATVTSTKLCHVHGQHRQRQCHNISVLLYDFAINYFHLGTLFLICTFSNLVP